MQPACPHRNTRGGKVTLFNRNSVKIPTVSLFKTAVSSPSHASKRGGFIPASEYGFEALKHAEKCAEKNGVLSV